MEFWRRRVEQGCACSVILIKLIQGTAYIPDFTSESTVELDVAVLSSNLDIVAHKLRSRDEVDRGGSNDNLCKS